MPWSGNKAPDQKGEDGQALALWMEDELERFANEQIDNLQAIDLRPTYNPPLRPREAMIAYADGTKWNPGYGAGPYYRNSAGLWVPLGGRTLVPATTWNYYVRLDGSDSNTGTSNTAGGAFLNIQTAVNKLAQLDVNGQTASINVADGDYTGQGTITLKNVVGSPGGSGVLNMLGNTTTPSNVLVKGFSADSLYVPWTIRGFKGVNAAGNLFGAYRGSRLFIGDIEIGNCVTGLNPSGGYITAFGTPISISGIATVFYYSESSLPSSMSFPVTILGLPSCSVFCTTTYMSLVYVHTSTFSFPNATFDSATDRCTVTAHGRSVNDPVCFTTTGAMPAPLVALTTYFVKSVVDANTITLSATAGGATIDLTTNGSSCKGGVVGQRYSVLNNSFLFSNGGGANFLPGNTAGAADATSTYA